MLNVSELEQKYKKRVYKKYIVWIIVFALICIIATSIIYWKQHAKGYLNIKVLKKTKIKPTIPIKINKVKTINKQPINKQTTQTKIIQENIQAKPQNNQVLQPSMQFIHNIHSDVAKNRYKTIIPTRKQTIQKIATKKLHPKSKISVAKHMAPTKVVISPMIKQNVVTITSTPVYSNLKDIIKRFRRTNSPVLGLFLARTYYHLKKYNLAYNYALLTNQLDNNNEQSWMIFAKSLVKLGQKKMAIQTLKSYIKMSHSNNAAVLLEDIQSGRFR